VSLDDPAALSGDVSGRRISDSPASDANIDHTLKWLESCREGHPACSEGRSELGRIETVGQALPTRLVEINRIGGELKTRLYETAPNEKGYYSALSHCWGHSQILTTTNENIREHCVGIAFSLLSKTFQDAVSVSFKLGVRYLWIDSLCIIQDNTSDWQQESSKMNLVYQNALFTIAAEAAADGQGGCFIMREKSDIQPVDIEYLSSDGKQGKVFIQGHFPSFEEEILLSPLSKRGWTLQERLLSKRIIHFCKGQIYWECQTTCIAESGLEMPQVLGIFLGISRILKPMKEGVDIFQDYQSIYWEWFRLLVVYTERNLTKNQDKLPALSGLAREFAQRTGDEYYAGLWFKFLPLGLLWEVKETALSYRVPHRAPSWSWASVDGPLGMPHSNPRCPQFRVSILAIHTTLLGKDPYGQVIDGIIKLCCKLANARCGPTRSPKYLDHPDISAGFYPVHMNDKQEIVGYYAPDETNRTPEPQLTALLIGDVPVRVKKYETHCVLFVEASDDENGQYRRVGMGQIWKSCGLFDEVAEEEITIV
jgi:hypothetical protein